MKISSLVQLGEILYPSDNSYAYNITTGEYDRDAYLAGCLVFTELAKPVEIISLPYGRHTVIDDPESEIEEFVDVIYGGQVFSILNSFWDSEDEMSFQSQADFYTFASDDDY